MKLSDIRSNLYSIINPLPFMELFDASKVLLIDDGNQRQAMESALADSGMVILLLPPQCIKINEQSRKQVSLDYATTVWIRTNPKVKHKEGEKIFDPLEIEQQIIPAVITWIPKENFGQKPFTIPNGLEPESDWSDIGNDSRLIRFSTQIIYSTNTTTT